MIAFFAKAGVVATAVAGGIAIVGSTIAGIALAISRSRKRESDFETAN